MSELLPEFSRPVAAHAIESDGLEMTIVAEPGELADLAARFGIPAIERLEARLRLHAKGDMIHLDGHLTADVVQTCVVTLEPVGQHIDADFARSYGDEQAVARVIALIDAADEVDALAEDEPDLIQNGHIDVGEATAEELALQLDPFPRKPGASLDNSPYLAKPEDEEEKPHPFAGLAKLRDKLNRKV